MGQYIFILALNFYSNSVGIHVFYAYYFGHWSTTLALPCKSYWNIQKIDSQHQCLFSIHHPGHCLISFIQMWHLGPNQSRDLCWWWKYNPSGWLIHASGCSLTSRIASLHSIQPLNFWRNVGTENKRWSRKKKFCHLHIY